MAVLPEIFAGFEYDGRVYADVLKTPAEPPAPSDPAAFAQEWRDRARAAARAGKRILAQGKGQRVWKLAGGRAVEVDGPGECEPGELAGAALFLEGDHPKPSPEGVVSFASDSDRLLYQALWPQHAGERPDPADLSGEADGPRGGLGWVKLRTLARLHGLWGDGLDEVCAKFSWAEGGETELPAGAALLELGTLLADRGAAYFTANVSARWLGGLTAPPSGEGDLPVAHLTSMSDWTRARAILSQSQVEAEARKSMEKSAIVKAPLRQVIEDVGRLGVLADSIAPADYVNQHESLVRENLAEASPEALSEHPHMLITLDDLDKAATSARPLISVRLGDGFVPEAVIPTPAGAHVYRREDLYELGGADEIRELALIDWARTLLESGVTPEVVAGRLAPFCVPGGRPITVAADGVSRWAIRPSLDVVKGQIRHTPCKCGGEGMPTRKEDDTGDRADRFVAVCASAATYDEAIEALAKSGAILPTAASDPVLRQILLSDVVVTQQERVNPSFTTATIEGVERPVVAFGKMSVYRDGSSYGVAHGGRKVASFSARASAFALAGGLAGRTGEPSGMDVADFCATAGIDPLEEFA